MSNESETAEGARSFPASVANVISDYRVVINRGLHDGVRLKERFMVYAVSPDPITDPETGDSLGYLEIVKGTGLVVHVQDRMATIETDQKYRTHATRRIIKRSPFSIDGNEEVIENPSESTKPFDDPKVGDKAKRV